MLDSITLSSMLASRLCHDLINPVGALGAGLEIMEGEQDPDMRAEAMNLVNSSTDKALDLLQFARIAYGAGGGYRDELDLDEIKVLVEGVYKHARADLDWQIPPGHMAKPAVKIMMTMALLIADCAPRRGSKVTIAQDEEGISLTATGPKARLKEPLQQALEGKEEGLEPKMVPAYIAAHLASQTGYKLLCSQDGEEKVAIRLQMS